MFAQRRGDAEIVQPDCTGGCRLNHTGYLPRLN